MYNYNKLIEGKTYHINGKGNCILSDKPNLCFTPVNGGEPFLYSLKDIDDEQQTISQLEREGKI